MPTKRKKWPIEAEEAREDAIAKALDTKSTLTKAMELLEKEKAIPVAIELYIELYAAAQHNSRVIEILKQAKQ